MSPSSSIPSIGPPLVYRPAEVTRMLGVKRITLWRWCSNGSFPKPLQLGPHSIGWLAKDIEAWLESRRTEPKQGCGVELMAGQIMNRINVGEP